MVKILFSSLTILGLTLLASAAVAQQPAMKGMLKPELSGHPPMPPLPMGEHPAISGHPPSKDGGTKAPPQEGDVVGAHGAIDAGAAAEVDVSGIERAEGGKTVAELFDEKAALSGQEVVLRGKVVKMNSGIMQRNWLHLRDGTSTADGKNDLTVTTVEVASVGDTVVVRGKLVTDKDFGFGYKYDVMIEDATVMRQ